MINIQLEGFDQVRHRLDALAGGDAINKALADGINRTMRAIEQTELNAMESDIDKPTPFTMNALRMLPAKPKAGRLNAILFVQPIQAKYLQTVVKGGAVKTIRPILGSGIKMTAYGNIQGKRGGGLESIALKHKGLRHSVFVGKPRNWSTSPPLGVWRRLGKTGHAKIELIAVAEADAKRTKKWDFFMIGQRVADQRLRADVAEAIELALRAR